MNITIKNVPIKVHRYFKRQAKNHHRSLNQELIVSLLTLSQQRRSREETQRILASVRKLRNQLPPVNLSDEEIKAAIHEGRA